MPTEKKALAYKKPQDHTQDHLELSLHEVREQLERILQSSDFIASDRLSRFLRFVVEETLNGHAEQLKGYTIAIDVFGRDSNFDPQTNPLVRVHARNLRHGLERYYLLQGQHDPIRIDIPKGGYVPIFKKISQNASERSVKARKAPSSPETAPDMSEGSMQRPSIAVLPFLNFSRERELEYLADGFAEELSMELSRFQELAVIAFYSTRRFKHQQIDLRDLGRELGVNYAITGSIHTQSNRLKITVQLSSTESGEQLWSRRFVLELTTTHLFDAQNEIICSIVAEIGDSYGVLPRSISKASSRKRVEHLNVYDAVLRMYHYDSLLSPEAHGQALEALKHAVELDAEYALLWAMLAVLFVDSYTLALNEIDHAVEQAEHCARRALMLDPRCQYAHYGMVLVFNIQRNPQAVIHEAEQIIDLNPNAAYMLGTAGFWIAVAGEFERGLALLEQGIRLNPYYPGWFHYASFLHWYRQRNYEEALREAHKMNLPDLFWDPLLHAAALGQLGHQKHAHAAFQKLLRLRPDFPTRAREYVGSYVLQDDLLEHVLEGLRKAGL